MYWTSHWHLSRQNKEQLCDFRMERVVSMGHTSLTSDSEKEIALQSHGGAIDVSSAFMTLAATSSPPAAREGGFCWRHWG